MIITGAPIEDLDYEDVDYWNELCEIMDYSCENVYSTIHLCWGALAGLYYHFGVRKVHLPEKNVRRVRAPRGAAPPNPLVRGFDEIFYAPHSRWAGLNRADIDAAPELRMLAESDVAGPMLLSTESGRQIFCHRPPGIRQVHFGCRVPPRCKGGQGNSCAGQLLPGR